MRKKMFAITSLSLALLCGALLGCGPVAPYDQVNLAYEGNSQLTAKHREMLRASYACLASKCQGEGDLKSRNELVSLKCHTLQLTLTHYEQRCPKGQALTATNEGSESEATRLGFDCVIGSNDVALLHDTLSILQCR